MDRHRLPQSVNIVLHIRTTTKQKHIHKKSYYDTFQEAYDCKNFVKSVADNTVLSQLLFLLLLLHKLSFRKRST